MTLINTRKSEFEFFFFNYLGLWKNGYIKVVNSCWLIQLSNKRRVVIQDFRGKTLVSIREFYEKDGKQIPTAKGEHICILLFFC